MIRQRLVISSFICGLLCMTAFAIVNTEGQKGVVRTLTAKTYGQAKLHFGLGVNYAQDNTLIGFAYFPQNNGFTHAANGSARLLNSTVNIGIGILPFMDLAGSLPIYYDKTNLNGGKRDGGIGDLSVSLKLLYPPPTKRRVFYQSYYLSGTIPTGNKSNGIFPRHACYLKSENEKFEEGKTQWVGRFYTHDCLTFKPMMLWTFDIGSAVPEFQFQIHVNLGGIFSLDADRNNLVLANVAMEYAPVEMLTLFVDFAGQSRWQNFESTFELGSDPLMLSPGLKINTPSGFYISLAGDFTLLSRNSEEYWNPDHEPVKNWKYTTFTGPKTGFQAAIGWSGFLVAQDDDRDGIKNDNDRCPKDAEDRDGFEDGDGCPDDDNDNDGIPDIKDKCPNEAEDRDGFEDEDGCPELDNDNDGIADLQDKCPFMAEDNDGFEDGDGCPENDNDKDGIPDSADQCPNEPEDIDGFEDNDGCPDKDNDKDGIPDLKDKCPNEPEVMNGIDDDDGCPDKKPQKKTSSMLKHQTLYGVQFTSGSAQMSFDSYRYLDPIIKEMKEYPEIQIEIRGHTDSIGKYESNMQLSKQRAESVKVYLVKNGIDPKRIRAVGFGSSSPIADNRTAAGRAKNRRIEIVRIK